MDEQDLRAEIRELCARGFGRIELVVLSGRNPALEHFAGKGIYQGSFSLVKAEDARYILKLGKAADTVAVWINGTEIPGIDQVFRRADVTDYIRGGKNEIRVRVVTNLHARLTASFDPADYEKIPFTTPSMDHRFGMWEEEGFPIGIAQECLPGTDRM